MKDRKTWLIFLIPLLFFVLAVGGAHLYEKNGKAPDPPEQQIREGADLWRPEDHLVDLNRGTYEDFLTLPGIGETRARLILEYREEYGGFRSVYELLNIKGIGESQLEELMRYVCVED